MATRSDSLSSKDCRQLLGYGVLFMVWRETLGDQLRILVVFAVMPLLGASAGCGSAGVAGTNGVAGNTLGNAPNSGNGGSGGPGSSGGGQVQPTTYVFTRNNL